MAYPGVAQAGGKFGQKLAKPHENKPGVVLVFSALLIAGGWWLKGHAGTGAEENTFVYWLGIGLMGFGAIGLIRGFLLWMGVQAVRTDRPADI
jgi:hypothetical protein